jgi:hypothetical protein
MKTIIYRKSDLRCVGTIQENTTFGWEIEHNVIPNFNGTESDYESIETNFERFHLERVNGEVVVIEDELTDDEKKVTLRSIRNTLLDQADIKYCNADKWELMTEETKTAWRTWKQNMKNWIGVDLDLGTFPSIPE